MSRSIRSTRGYMLAVLVLAAVFLVSKPAVAGNRNAGAPAGAAVDSWAGEEGGLGALWLEGCRWLSDWWLSWTKEGPLIDPNGHKALAVRVSGRSYSGGATRQGAWTKEGPLIDPNGGAHATSPGRPSGQP